MSLSRKQVVAGLAQHFEGNYYPFDLDSVWTNYGGMTRDEARRFIMKKCQGNEYFYYEDIDGHMYLSLAGLEHTLLLANSNYQNFHRLQDILSTLEFSKYLFLQTMESLKNGEDYPSNPVQIFRLCYENFEFHDETDRGLRTGW